MLFDNPFINLSARSTGPLMNPAEQDIKLTKTESKPKKKSHKSSKSEKTKASVNIDTPASVASIPGPGDDMQEPVFRPVSSAASSLTGQESKSAGSIAQAVSSVSQTGQGTVHTGTSTQYDVAPDSAVSGDSASVRTYPDQEYRDPPVHSFSDDDFSDENNSVAEEGEVSYDNLEKQEQTENMTFRETVRSVCSFMGWDYIPVFESDLSEPDKSNNPWRGKHPRKPARISLQKLEKLNITVAEGYPSSAQDSAGLKKDQFVKIPKSQSRWYQMHTLRQDGPHRLGKSLFRWGNSEAKVNSQFPRIIKASSYPPSGPPSRPISQEYL